MRTLLKKLIPKSFAGWSVVAIVAGILCGFVLGPLCSMFEPLGKLFIRAYSLTLLPYLIFEITGVFGAMKRASFVALLKNGGLAILLMGTLGATAVTLLPLMLPPLISSPLFDPTILTPLPSGSLMETFLPANIFSALVQGNVPGIIFFAILIGVVLQNMKTKEPILNLIQPLRQLFSEVFGIIAKKAAPVGIFALTASAIGTAQDGELQRIFALLALMVTGFVILGIIILPGIISSFTRYTPLQVWRVLRDPLVLTVATGNILIAMPLTIESLKRVLVDEDTQSDRGDFHFEAVEAMVPLCFSLFGIGRHLLVVVFPFLGWFHDMPMSTEEILRNIPLLFGSAMGGLQAALLIELPRLGLPVHLVSFYLLNSQWLLRISDPLTLIGTTTVALLLFASMKRRLVFRPVRILGTSLLAVAFAVTLGVAGNRLLASTMTGSNSSSEIILSRESLMDFAKPTILANANPPAPTTLSAIKERGVLRAGVRLDSVPWVYRNRKGDLTGYDVDLLSSLAASLNVRLELVEGETADIKKWLIEQRIDCAAGGLHSTGLAKERELYAIPYEKVSLALVVSDSGVKRIQDLIASNASASLNLATHGRQDSSDALRTSMESKLSRGGIRKSVSFLPIQDTREFIEGLDKTYDALLTSAEAGSAFAVLHPQTTMLPTFGNSLSADIVLVFPKTDEALLDYVAKWIAENQNLDLLERLRNHWILFKSGK